MIALTDHAIDLRRAHISFLYESQLNSRGQLGIRSFVSALIPGDKIVDKTCVSPKLAASRIGAQWSPDSDCGSSTRQIAHRFRFLCVASKLVLIELVKSSLAMMAVTSRKAET